MNFNKLGISNEEIQRNERLGLKYDKRTKRNFIEEHDHPSIASEGDLTALELAISSRLPADYREFILAENGGRPESHIFPLNNNLNVVVDYLFPARFREKSYELLYKLSTTYSGRISHKCLPIGKDPSGNLFLICLDPSFGYGAIYLWDHEKESHLPNYDNMKKLSDSFSQFISALL